MAVGGPACRRLPLFHDHQTVSIGQREILVAKRGKQTPHLCEFPRIERLNAQIGEGIEKDEKLGAAVSVIAPKKPAVSLSDDQG
jgi:hypothetical protein